MPGVVGENPLGPRNPHHGAACARRTALCDRLARVALVAWTGCAIATHAWALDTEPHRQWFTLELDGTRAGYAYRERLERDAGVVEREVLVLELAGPQGRSRVEQRIEVERDRAGPVRAVALDAVVGTARTQWQATIADGALRVAPGQVGGPEKNLLPLPSDAVFPFDEPGLLRSLQRGGQSTLEYRIFDPVSAQTVPVTARRLGDAPAASGPTRIRTTRRLHGNDRYQDYWLDADGSVQKVQAQFLGLSLAWMACTAQCDRPVEPPFNPLTRLALRSPLPISTRIGQGRIRYVLSRSDGQAPRLVESGEQSVVHAGARAIVTVCAECDPRENASRAELARYLAPNAWVQSDHPDIRRLALASARPGDSVARRMHDLAAMVREKMRGPVDYLGYADALQALESGSGDCTEFAVLLAALARAHGIPTRLVFGLAYADRFGGQRGSFTPHAWVQAWNGRRWASFDAALGAFDATHIALALGSGDPTESDADFRQVRLLRIEKAGLVRR